MKKCQVACLVLILGLTGPYLYSQSVDLKAYNIRWSTQSKNSSESMPLVGGDIGCNVWVEQGDILFYMQRSGSLSENGEYLKLGRIRIRLSPNPFDSASSFSQELKLEEGLIEIKGQKSEGSQSVNATLRLWVEVQKPIIHVEVASTAPVQMQATYESWRTEDKELKPGKAGERWGCFNLEGYPGKVIRKKDSIAFADNGVLFYHRNPKEKLIPDVLIQQQGLSQYNLEIQDDIKDRTFGGILSGAGFVPDGTTTGIYGLTSYKGWRLISRKPSLQHQVTVATHIAQAPDLEQWEQDLKELQRTNSQPTATSFQENRQWWKEFWNRSWIKLSPDHPYPADSVWQMGRNYQLFRYQLGGNALGEYPTKFNGGNLTFDPSFVDENKPYDPDWRAWGGAVFTAQNQRLLYWPLLKTGDFEAMIPQFELYRKGLGGARARVKKHFGHQGAVFCEYMSVPGLALGAGWGWKEPSHRVRGPEIPFGDPRATALKGYNDLVEQGVMANPAISYHWESQVEHAYMLLEYHRYSGIDISPYIPFIKEALIFFDEHYQLRQQIRFKQPLDENGKLLIYPSTSCESYRGAKNPSDLVSGLRACITAILALKEDYFTPKEKTYFQEYLTRLPGYYYDEIKGDTVINPAASWGRYQNVECPQFYPLFPFNQFHLGKDDLTVFRNTWKHGKFPKNMVISWHQDGIFYARMGMTKEASRYNLRKLHDSNRRFPTFWGPGHDWVPDHNWGGSGMIGLQEMLMQCFDEKIYLLPSWPKNWEVEFKLHAPNKTVVTASVRKGEITNLEVYPKERIKDIVIAKGWVVSEK